MCLLCGNYTHCQTKQFIIKLFYINKRGTMILSGNAQFSETYKSGQSLMFFSVPVEIKSNRIIYHILVTTLLTTLHPFLHRYKSYMRSQTTYISRNMLSYRDNTLTSLSTLLIQTISMPLHLSTQNIIRLINYCMSLHLYGTILVRGR